MPREQADLPLDQRHIDILGILLESPCPLSAKSISQSLHTTPRVVRYQLHYLSEWLRARGLDLVQRPGTGISIAAPEAAKDRLRRGLSQKDRPVSHYQPEDRLHFLLFSLLTQSGVIAVKQFQYRLGAARNTILKDLQKAAAWLAPFGIQLNKRQNYGCYLQGGESSFRKAIVAVLSEALGEVQLLSIFGDLDDFSPGSAGGSRGRIVYIDYLKSLQLKFFDGLIDQIQEINHKLFTDRGRMMLSLQLAISIQRLENRWSVDISPSEVEQLRQETDYHLSATLVEKIRRHFRLSIPEPETAYLMLRIKEAESRGQIVNPALLQEINASGYKDINQIVEALLGYVALYLHPALRLDQELKNGLTAHFLNLMDSPGSKTGEADPLLEEMQRVYPETYKVTRDSVAELNQQLGMAIQDEEIGYITMHLVAAMERLRMRSRTKRKVIIICNAGRATSQLLASRVATEFPELEISAICSYLEYKTNRRAWEYDFVITTIPILPEDKPCITVGPLLDREDVQRIRSALDPLEPRASVRGGPGLELHKQACLAELLLKDTIELQWEAATWQDLVDKAGGLLLNVQAIEPGYITAMKSVREEYGPYMVIMPGLALLHAFPGDGVKRLCMSMVTLKRPVAFGHADFDPVRLAFALGAVDHQSHLRALSEMIAMVKDERTISSLCSTAIKSKAINIIRRYSQEAQ